MEKPIIGKVRDMLKGVEAGQVEPSCPLPDTLIASEATAGSTQPLSGPQLLLQVIVLGFFGILFGILQVSLWHPVHGHAAHDHTRWGELCLCSFIHLLFTIDDLLSYTCQAPSLETPLEATLVIEHYCIDNFFFCLTIARWQWPLHWRQHLPWRPLLLSLEWPQLVYVWLMDHLSRNSHQSGHGKHCLVLPYLWIRILPT